MSRSPFSFLSILFAVLISAPLAVQANSLCSYPSGDFSVDIAVKWDGAASPVEGAPMPEGNEALQLVNVTRVGKTIRYQFHWAGDRVTEVWKDAATGLFVQQSGDADNKSIYIDTQLLVWMPPLAKMEAGTIDWITPANFKEEISFNGRKTVRHEQQMTFSHGATPIYQAWIDKETKRPIVFHDGEARYTLSYGAQPPVGPLEMPPVLKQELERQLKASQGPSYL